MQLKKYASNLVLAVLLVILTVLIAFTIQKVYAYYSMKKNNQQVLGTNDNKIKIGFSLGTLKEDRWVTDRDILMAKARELGADILVQNANNDNQDQLNQVKYLLSQHINVLIIVPNDLKKAAAAVELAHKAGVKVISYDRLVSQADVDLYISFDNVEVGTLMAQALVNKVPKGNYLIINGATTDNNTAMLKEGYDKVLDPLIKNGSIHIISENWAQNWMSEDAFNITNDTLKQGVKIDAILAGDDSLAGSAIYALSEHRVAGKTQVVGQDADLSACQRIVEGTQLMTVYKPIDKLAGDAAIMAIKLAKGENLNVSKTIYDGKYYVPYYVLQPIAVEKDNMDSTIIKDGFHSREDVYQNISGQ